MKAYRLLWMALLLTACNRYIVTLNEQPVYKPLPLFKDFQLPDKALDACVRQSITDDKVTDPERLHSLNCSHAGIKTLEGIQQFPALKNLNFSDNQLTTIEPLLFLGFLERVNLAGNPALACAALSRFASQTSAEVTLPDRCM